MKILKFNESNIDLKELEKTSKSGGLRGDVLVKKIKDKEDIIFKPKRKPTSSTKITNVDEIIPEITDDKGHYDPKSAKEFFQKGRLYDDVIEGEDDEIYKLNDIEKTSDFGSSGGASLGSKDTRNVECIQSLFLALRQEKGNDSISEKSVDDLFDVDGNIKKELLDMVKVPITIDRDMLDSYTPTWLSSFINTANALYEVRPIFTKDKKTDDNALSRRRRFIFYQIGYSEGLTKVLSDKYKSFTQTTGIPISKWTPSDVWVVLQTQHRLVISRINECKTLDDLNSLIDNLFDSKTLRGISLKKLKDIKSTSDIKIILNKVTPIPIYTFNKVVTSNNPLGSLGIKIISNRHIPIDSPIFKDGPEAMDVRSFSGPNTLSDVSGEVLGESARHGKVGLLRINKFIERIDPSLTKIPTRSELETISDRKLKSEINKINDRIKNIGQGVGTRGNISGRPRLVSKYQALKVAEFFYDNPNIADQLIQDIFYYAMSIKTDEFTCPKYVRII